MAKSSTRRVSIYINSEEVEATVMQIHFEMNKLGNEQNRMIIGCSLFLSCRRFAACTPFLRGTRLSRREGMCRGIIATDMQRLTALGRQQRLKDIELRT